MARGRGHLQLIKDELLKVNRDRPQRCVTGQITEFTGREKPKESNAGRPAYSPDLPQKRPKSRHRFRSSQRATNRRAYNRGRSPYINKYKRSPKREVKEEKIDAEN